MIFHVDLDSVASSDLTTPENAQKLYLGMIHYGLRLAPCFITLDMSLDNESIRRVIAAKGSTQIIAIYNSTRPKIQSWEDDALVDAYTRAQQLGFDVFRTAWPARCLEDNFGAQSFRSRVERLGEPVLPIVAYNTGSIGKTSACFNSTMTSVTHESIRSSDQLVNGPLLTVADAIKALFASYIFEPMKFYIIGAATYYSLSPAMHNAAFKLYGMPHVYQPHQTPTLNDLQGLVNDPHFGGASVSLPFKEEAIALTHSLSKHARAIGALNTLVPVHALAKDGSIPSELDMFNQRNRSGRVLAIYGENTDWHGIRACVRRGLSPVNAVGPRTTTLIVGAGGMARAAVYAMLQLGVQNIFIFNRTISRAEKLVAHFKSLLHRPEGVTSRNGVLSHMDNKEFKIGIIRSREEPWPADFRQPTIVVSCIPTHRIGDQPSPDFTLPPQWLKSPTGGVVMEVSPSNYSQRSITNISRSLTATSTHRYWSKSGQ
jgi:shikimate 5-dehydrogenase